MTFTVDGFFQEQEEQRQARPRPTNFTTPAADFQIDQGSDLFDFEDTVMAIPRAVEGFGRSVASILPGVDLNDARFFGRSETVVGAGLENILQFGMGFIPGLGIAGKLGKLKAVAGAKSALSASKAGRFTLRALQGSTAGAVADFTAFDGHEKNFSALVESIPQLRNPLTEFLATDEDDPEIVGRVKNVLEGLGIGSALGIIMEGARGLRAVRKARGVETAPEVLREAQTGAVDPGRLQQGVDEVNAARHRRESPQEIVDQFGPDTEITVRTGDEVATNIAPPAETIERTMDPEFALTLQDAFEGSKATREVPGGNPRKRSPEELVRDGLTAQNANLDKFILGEGAAHAHRAIEDVYRTALKKSTVSHEETAEAAVREAAASMGMNGDRYVEALRNDLGKGAEDLITLRAKSMAAADISQVILKGQADALQRAAAGDVGAFADLAAWAREDSALVESLDLVGTELGRTLEARKAFKAEHDSLRQLSAEFLEKRKGDPAQFEKFRQQLDTFISNGRTVEDFARARELATMTTGRQVWRAAHEMFVNSILSGPKTLVVQPLSAMMISVYKPLENMIGGLATGNRGIVKRSMYELTSLVGSVWDSALFGARALKENRNFLDPGNTLASDALRNSSAFQAGAFGTQAGTASGAALDFVGKLINVPTRLIRSADEFSKQLSARSAIRADAMTEALGMTRRVGFVAPARRLTSAEAKELDALFTARTGKKSGTGGPMSARERELRDIQDKAGTGGNPGRIEAVHDAASAGAFADQRLRDLVVDGQLSQEHLARQKAVAEGKKAGLVGDELEEYVEQNYLDKFDAGLSQSMGRALGVAQEVTLQTPLPQGGVAAKFQQALDSHPVFRFLVPFYRTPVNIAKFAGQRLDVASVVRSHLTKNLDGQALNGVRSRYLQDIMSGDPNRKAEAVGRFYTGLGLLGGATLMATSGMITGRGPTDPARRQAMLDAGWQPYSFRTPDGNYVQYLRMDPLATFFGLAADYADTIRLQGEDDDAEGHGHTMAILTAFANNFTQRSFLQGIGQVIDALSDPQKSMSQVVEQYAGAVVPNGLTQALQAFGDDTLRESHSIGERIRGRTPGLSGTATPRRNLLGEPIVHRQSDDSVDQWYSFLVPIAYREVSSDSIRRELFNLKHGFSPPKARMLGIDLREVRGENNQSAHDRWAQLHGEVRVNGKTLRQELSTLIRSANYRRLDPDPGLEGPSPRVALINSVVSRFRSKAFDAMLREYPELRSEIATREANKAARKRGLAALRGGVSTQIGNFPTN